MNVMEAHPIIVLSADDFPVCGITLPDLNKYQHIGPFDEDMAGFEVIAWGKKSPAVQFREWIYLVPAEVYDLIRKNLFGDVGNE